MMLIDIINTPYYCSTPYKLQQTHYVQDGGRISEDIEYKRNRGRKNLQS